MTETPHPSAPPPAPLREEHATDGFFATIRAWQLPRDTSNRWVGGVCSGLAHRFGVDPLLLRAAALLLILFGGVGLAAYLLAWLLLPDGQGRILGEEALLRGDAGAIALIVAVALVVSGGAYFSDGRPFWFGGWVIPALVIGFIVWRQRSHRPAPPGAVPPPQHYATGPAGPAIQPTPGPSEAPMSAPMTAPASAPPAPHGAPAPYAAPPALGAPPAMPPGMPPAAPSAYRPLPPPPPPAPRRRRPGAALGLVTLGAAVVAYGVGYLLDGPTGFAGSPGLLGLIAALATTALIALGLGLSGRAGGAATILTMILAIATPTAAVAEFVTDARGGTGDRTWVATTSNTAATGYELGAGKATLDLTQLPRTGPTSVVYADQGVGELTIVVPRGVTTRVLSDVGIGSIDRSAVQTSETTSRQSGVGQSSSLLVGEGPEQVTVHADLGIGTIIITEG